MREIAVHWGFESTSEKLELSIRILSHDVEESITGQTVKF